MGGEDDNEIQKPSTTIYVYQYMVEMMALWQPNISIKQS